MAKSKAPRKKYVPRYQKGAIPLTIRFNDDTERALMIFPHQDFADYKNGKGTECGWHTIVQRLNVGQIMADRHFSEEARLDCREALDYMAAAHAKQIQTGEWALCGGEFVIGQALNMIDEMQKMCTRRELSSIIMYVNKVAGVKYANK